jgi:hypothetical protein
MISLKENITKQFLKEFEERRSHEKSEDIVDGKNDENSKDFYFNGKLTDVKILWIKF